MIVNRVDIYLRYFLRNRNIISELFKNNHINESHQDIIKYYSSDKEIILKFIDKKYIGVLQYVSENIRDDK